MRRRTRQSQGTLGKHDPETIDERAHAHEANRRKHGVSFEEAQTVFFDESAMEFMDPDHSEDEDRFLLLGLSFRLRVPVVCHCHRESQGIIRIITARKATRKERSHYTEAKP